MVWKKNSVAVSPLKKLLATKPFAAGKRLFASKCGSVLEVFGYINTVKR